MTHFFDTEIAEEVGTTAATIYAHIEFWVRKKAATGADYYDGRYWTYCSLRMFQEFFPYLTEKEIRTALGKLKQAGLIATACYNRCGLNRTTWYSTGKEIGSEPTEIGSEDAICRKGPNVCPKRQEVCPKGQGVCPKRRTNTDISTDNINILGGDKTRVMRTREGVEAALPDPPAPPQSDPDTRPGPKPAGRRAAGGEADGRAAVEQFRGEALGRSVKREQLMMKFDITDPAEYESIAEEILGDWLVAEEPPSEVNWRHFQNTFRIKAQKRRKNGNEQQPGVSPAERRKREAEELVASLVAKAKRSKQGLP